MNGHVFTPYYGQTQAAATVAGAVNVNVNPAGRALLIQNVGTQLAFVRVKPAGVAADASATDMPIPANEQRVILKSSQNSVAQGETIVSVFATAVGSTVYVTPGDCPGI